MWAINDMFGTGIKGLVGITTVLALGTYLTVFSLLHRTRQRQAIESLRRLFRFPRPQIPALEEKPSLEPSQDEGPTQETTSSEQTGIQEEAGKGSKWKSLRARLSRAKRREHDDEARVS
jgi:hypothetical protein